MLISIDHGNYAIKTPHDSFVSGLSEHTAAHDGRDIGI